MLWGEGFDLHLGDARAIDADGFCAGERQVKDAAGDEGAAIGDAHDDGLAGREVGHTDGRAQGQRAMRGGEGVLVEDGAVGGLAVAVGRPVPAGEAGLGGDGLAFQVVGRQPGLGSGIGEGGFGVVAGGGCGG